MDEAQASWIAAPSSTAIEGTVGNAVEWLRLAVETCSAALIGVGVMVALYLVVTRQSGGFNRVRLTLARYLALALELQLGADILSTAIAPSWDQIGKLGAIAVIRTALNYFLMLEMREEHGAGSDRGAAKG